MRIGTRGSALALAQARWVAERIGDHAELVTITTQGDRERSGGDKARWVSELERALHEERIDLAVHSAKDVPTHLPEGLELAAIPERADAADVLCGAGSLAALGSGARVGTASLRRAAQLRAIRPDLDVTELRGNVDTRLRRLADGEVDALVLARAGLERLGRSEAIGAVLSELVPAAGQGALALEARAGAFPDGELDAVSDAVATACVRAERELTGSLGADCDTPIGAHARALGDGRIALEAWIGLPDGSEWIHDRIDGEPAGLGGLLAERLRAVGAEDLLARAAA